MEARTDESRRDVVKLVEIGASRSCTRLGQRTGDGIEGSSSSLKEGKLGAEYLLGSTAINIQLLIHMNSRD